VTFGVPVQGGAPAQNAFNQNITPANTAWAQQLEIWITPWGFLKGAAVNNATVRAQTIGGARYNVVTWATQQKAPSGAPYRVVGYINAQNLVEKVETWLENPVLGDMPIEVTYSHYRSKNGLKYPSAIVQKRGGWPTFEAQILGVNVNPENIAQLLTPPPPAAGRAGGPPPGGGGQATPPAAQAEKLAEGVYRITGGYIGLAIEFKDHIVVFEGGGQNEARALAILAEAKKAIPNKPIRYVVVSHHHFDHTSGIAAVVAEGATILTHQSNVAFFEKALSAPRTLAPDVMSKSGKKAKIEGVGDKRVLQDETRTIELHHIQGLPHADGMLVAYLPKERVMAFADMFNLPPANAPVPNPPVVGTQVMVENLERLKLDWENVISVHAPNPDRPILRADVLKTLGKY
jgi:glyoxylase-like metal-dependent hydrolase (beta-lactamase superfamily II)